MCIFPSIIGQNSKNDNAKNGGKGIPLTPSPSSSPQGGNFHEYCVLASVYSCESYTLTTIDADGLNC